MSDLITYGLGALALIITALSSIWATFRKGEKSGKNKSENKHHEQRSKSEGKANEANAKANDAAERSTDDTNRDWLREHTRRKPD